MRECKNLLPFPPATPNVLSENGTHTQTSSFKWAVQICYHLPTEKKHTEKEYGSSKTVQIDVLRDRFKRNLTCIPLPLIPFFSTQAETCQVTSDWLVAHRAGRLPTQKSQPRAEACPWFWRKDKKKRGIQVEMMDRRWCFSHEGGGEWRNEQYSKNFLGKDVKGEWQGANFPLERPKEVVHVKCGPKKTQYRRRHKTER